MNERMNPRNKERINKINEQKLKQKLRRRKEAIKFFFAVLNITHFPSSLLYFSHNTGRLNKSFISILHETIYFMAEQVSLSYVIFIKCIK